MVTVASEWSDAISFKVRKAGTSFSEILKIDYPEGGQHSPSGHSAAVSENGDVLLVSGYYDDSIALNGGAVYYYKKSGNTWEYHSKFHANDTAASDLFGAGIALNASGDYALIGAASKDKDGISDSGCVYVFTREGDTWTQQQKIEPFDYRESNQFGLNIALNADASIAFIGSYNGRYASNSTGGVYIYKRPVYRVKNLFKPSRDLSSAITAAGIFNFI